MSVSTTPVRPAAATWVVRHRWAAAVGAAVVPVVLTAAGSAVGQVLALPESEAALVIAAAAAVSALVGLLVARSSGQSLAQYGVRAPRRARAASWFVPPAVTVAVVIGTAGVAVPPALAGAYLVLAAAVAVNEEVWFRGLVLALLRPAGVRTALIGSSALFGLLHLANLAGGADPAMTALQVSFAVLFGVIAAELVIVTGSLWPAIGWHAAWDFVNYLGGNASTTPALVGVALACVVMVGYAVSLWRRSLAVAA